MKKLLLCASLLVSDMAWADTHICDPEMDLVEISNCIDNKHVESQHAIKQAYDNAMLRVNNKSALAKSQNNWYKKTQAICDKEGNEGSTSAMNIAGCLYQHNLQRIKYLNSL